MTLKAYRDHSMMFKGHVCHYAQITHHVKSAVRLANGKATEVRRVYLVRGVTVTECDGPFWVFVAQTRGVICSIT